MIDDFNACAVIYHRAYELFVLPSISGHMNYLFFHWMWHKVCELCTVNHIALMMAAASTSETSVNFYQTTRRNNPEDSHLFSMLFMILNTSSAFVFMYSWYIFSHPDGKDN
jgi:hypothetical protein